MNRTVCFAVVSASVAGYVVPSLGAPFTALVMDTGGVAGSLGSPITPSGGVFHLRLDGTQYPPDPDKLAADPASAIDSFVALGGDGSLGVVPYYVINGKAFAPGARAIDSPALAGVWFSPPVAASPIPGSNNAGSPAYSRAGPLAADSVYVARLVVDRGAHPVGVSICVGAVFNNEAYLARATLDGGATIESLTSPGGTPLASSAVLLRSVLVAQSNFDKVGPVDVYDVYIISAAAPPPAFLLAAPTPLGPPSQPPPPAASSVPEPSSVVAPSVIVSAPSQPGAPPQTSSKPSTAPASGQGNASKPATKAPKPTPSKASKKKPARPARGAPVPPPPSTGGARQPAKSPQRTFATG